MDSVIFGTLSPSRFHLSFPDTSLPLNATGEKIGGTCLLSQLLKRLRQKDYLRLGVPSQPRLHGETPSQKNRKQVKHVVHAYNHSTWEAEAGRS
jgi:hypothetical protein